MSSPNRCREARIGSFPLMIRLALANRGKNHIEGFLRSGGIDVCHMGRDESVREEWRWGDKPLTALNGFPLKWKRFRDHDQI